MKKRGSTDETHISNLDNECSQMARYPYQTKEEEEVDGIQITDGRARLGQGTGSPLLWVKKKAAPDTSMLEVSTEENQRGFSIVTSDPSKAPLKWKTYGPEQVRELPKTTPYLKSNTREMFKFPQGSSQDINVSFYKLRQYQIL